MDSTDCQQSTFALNTSLPEGWSGSISPSLLSLASGGTGSATLSVTSAVNSAEGACALDVQVSDAATPVHTASCDATYTVLPPAPVCSIANPVISISPTSQSGQAGSTLLYSISIRNMDSEACDATTYSVASSLPAGWSGLPSPDRVTLVPGGTGSMTLSVTSTNTASPADYVFNITISDVLNSSHSASGNAVYTIPTDTTPPTAPTGLTANYARKKIMLSWNASTDNRTVAGYKIWRNSVVIGETTETAFSDASITKGESYTYFVTAFDEEGNISSPSNQAVVTFDVPGRPKKK